MKNSFFLLAGVLLLLLTVNSCGKTKYEMFATLYGVVTDKATGEPIRAAGVQLSTGAKTVTGNDGQYEFAELEAGEYTLQVTKTGYIELEGYKITVGAGATAKGDVQIEKLPPALKVVDDKGNEIDSLDFGSAEADITRSFGIFNDSPETLIWQMTETSNWITKIDVENGSLKAGLTQSIVVTINRDALKNGENRTILHITSDNGNKQIIIKALGQGLPFCNTLDVSNVTNMSATFNGKIVSAGLPEYTERGFVYADYPQPEIDGNIGKQTCEVTNNPDFSTSVTNLTGDKTYYVRAYVKNLLGVSYGNDISFVTSKVETALTTSAVTNITASSAVFKATIVKAGEPAYTEKGFCYSSAGEPAISNNKTIVSGAGTGEFSIPVSGLEYNKTYNVRAYAIQNGKIIYGNMVNFSTVYTVTNVSTSAVSDIYVTSATFNAVISDIGDPAYTEHGFCFNKTGNPTILDHKIMAGGSGTGSFSLPVTDLEYKTTYYVCAYVMQNGAPVYANVVTFSTFWVDASVVTFAASDISLGKATLKARIDNVGEPYYTERGFCIMSKSFDEVLEEDEISFTPTISDDKIPMPGTGLSVGGGNYLCYLTGVKEQQVYATRAYLVQENVVVYGETTYFISISQPVVATNAVENITATSAALRGDISFKGYPEYVERGFVVSVLNVQPTLSTSNTVKVPIGGSGTGLYGGNVTGLTKNTTYYVRAFATSSNNSVGTIYGQTVSFKAQ